MNMEAATGNYLNVSRKQENLLSRSSSGSLAYGHHNINLGDVTMDDNTHSVYLATETPWTIWYAYSDKTGNGGHCTGALLGNFEGGGGCHNLDSSLSSRIRCMRYGNP